MKEINYEKRLDALEELETLYKFRKEAIFKDKYIETFYFIRKEEIQYSYPLENRINDAGRIYFEQNWPEFYNNMEEKLMEAQKEVSNEQNKLNR